MTEDFKHAISLLGKQVVVYLSNDKSDEQAVARGKFLRIGDCGEFVIEDDMGFLHYAWPMLSIREADND